MSQSASDQNLTPITLNRRTFLIGALSVVFTASIGNRIAFGKSRADEPVNLAKVAKPSSSYTSGDTRVSAMNDGFVPRNSADDQHSSYGNWPKVDTEWVEYEWSQPVTTSKVDVYWWMDGQGVGAPKSYRVTYWNGSEFVPVANASGLGIARNTFNTTTFDEIHTTKLRLEILSDGRLSTGILEWKVISSGAVPNFPPTVDAGIDRAVVLGGKTYLDGKAEWLKPSLASAAVWSKVSGPGRVNFAKASEPETTATFSAPGDYVLKLSAHDGNQTGESTVKVRAEAAPPKRRLDVVYT